MTMRIYNTKTRQKEDFIPLAPDSVSIYCCGPTTYNYIHLGNARPLVVFDTVRRFFIRMGYKTAFVQNFTDIDDKIINRAREEGLTCEELSSKYIAAYYEDAAALNIKEADFHPRVTEHMPEIIALVQKIIDAGHAYEASGDVYFDVRSFEGYGGLSGRDLDDMRAGARVEPGAQKRDPLDFALWKAAKSGEPAWDSPFGAGRPGWHIECSAMSSKYLGDNFDIHGGGADLIFPHHENELAQSESAGCGFARYWMHNGFITINREKMSKSSGNFFLLRDILSRFSGETVRFYLLGTHYRSPIDFDDEKLLAAQKALERIKNCFFLLGERRKTASPGTDTDLSAFIARAKDGFISAMEDDFNTALAIAEIFDFCHELNACLNKPGSPAADSLDAAALAFAEWFEVLGLPLPEEKSVSGREDDLLRLILEIRSRVRADKNWALADAIRDGLKELGIVLDDSPAGVHIRYL